MAMNPHDASLKPNGKVLLYTSQDQGADDPAMMMMHGTVALLPPVYKIHNPD